MRKRGAAASDFTGPGGRNDGWGGVAQRLILIGLVAGQPAAASAESDIQQWLGVSAGAEIGKSLAIQGEAIARISATGGGLYEVESSLLMGYNLSKGIAAWAGYVHNPSYSEAGVVAVERRAREQITAANFAKLGPMSLSARLRFEQRWRDNSNGTAWRARPYVRAAVPLGGAGGPALNLTCETFFNLSSTSFQPSSGLERVRSAISLSAPVAKAVELQVGYLNQHRFVRNGEDRSDHAMTVTLALSL